MILELRAVSLSIGGTVLVLVGNMGTRTGLATMSLTKGSFGLRGSYLPVAANVVILMGWSWVQAMLAGVTVNFLVAQATGYSNPVCGIFATKLWRAVRPSAYFGLLLCRLGSFYLRQRIAFGGAAISLWPPA